MITLTVGSTLQSGKYEIIKILGQGGFGITYLAKHRLLGTLFAIKEFFPQDYCNREGDTSHITVATRSNVDLVEKLRNRFITEARNIASLKHPGIIQIHDVFEENNTAYYVMDFIEGMSLDDMVSSQGPLPEREAISYVAKVGEALDFIHARNMTHFDVKPANIMVRKSDGAPILIDFGLSKQFNEQGHARSTLLMGVSHGFSALEQYFQEGITGFSPQTDVYSLGATLYYLLTSRVPPEAPRLSGTLIEVPATVSPNVAEAIKWSMVSDMNKRCPTARDFINALNDTTQSSLRTVALGAASYAGAPAGTPKTHLAGAVPPPPQSPAEFLQQSEGQSLPEYSSKENKKNTALVVVGIVVGLLIIGAMIYFFMNNTKSTGAAAETVDSTAVSQSSYTAPGVEEVAVEENVEEPAVVEAEPVEAVSTSDRQFGTFRINGNIDGYAITMIITCKYAGEGTCEVDGKYAYQSTLKKYGDNKSSWFYFHGYGNEDGTNIECDDTTPSNPDYSGHLSVSFINGVLRGSIYSNVEFAPVCSIYAD